MLSGSVKTHHNDNINRRIKWIFNVILLLLLFLVDLILSLFCYFVCSWLICYWNAFYSLDSMFIHAIKDIVLHWKVMFCTLISWRSINFPCSITYVFYINKRDKLININILRYVSCLCASFKRFNLHSQSGEQSRMNTFSYLTVLDHQNTNKWR